jgi:hypothetical protein
LFIRYKLGMFSFDICRGVAVITRDIIRVFTIVTICQAITWPKRKTTDVLNQKPTTIVLKKTTTIRSDKSYSTQ